MPGNFFLPSLRGPWAHREGLHNTSIQDKGPLTQTDQLLKETGISATGIDYDGKEGISSEELNKALVIIHDLHHALKEGQQTIEISGKNVVMKDLRVDINTLDTMKSYLHTAWELRKKMDLTTTLPENITVQYIQNVVIKKNTLVQDSMPPVHQADIRPTNVHNLKETIEKARQEYPKKPISIVFEWNNMINKDVNNDYENDISHADLVSKSLTAQNQDVIVIKCFVQNTPPSSMTEKDQIKQFGQLNEINAALEKLEAILKEQNASKTSFSIQSINLSICQPHDIINLAEIKEITGSDFTPQNTTQIRESLKQRYQQEYNQIEEPFDVMRQTEDPLAKHLRSKLFNLEIAETIDRLGKLQDVHQNNIFITQAAGNYQEGMSHVPLYNPLYQRVESVPPENLFGLSTLVNNPHVHIVGGHQRTSEDKEELASYSLANPLVTDYVTRPPKQISPFGVNLNHTPDLEIVIHHKDLSTLLGRNPQLEGIQLLPYTAQGNHPYGFESLKAAKMFKMIDQNHEEYILQLDETGTIIHAYQELEADKGTSYDASSLNGELLRKTEP